MINYPKLIISLRIPFSKRGVRARTGCVRLVESFCLATVSRRGLGSWCQIQNLVGGSLNKLRAILSVNDLFFFDKLLEKLRELLKLISTFYPSISWLKEEVGTGYSRILKDDLEKMRQ